MTKHYTDYDLAILGGSTASRLAACIATQKGARVALIAPTWRVNDAAERCLGVLLSSAQTEAENGQANLLSWESHQQKHFSLSPSALSSQGIDVILEPVQFTENQVLKSDSRCLKASRYLLADGYGSPASPVSKDKTLLYHQLAELENLPAKVAIVGQGATIVEWAYALSRFTNVTLVSTTQQLLPAEDRAIQRLSKAQLSSLGITTIALKNCSQTDAATIKNRAQLDTDCVVVVPDSYSWESTGLNNLDIKLPVVVNRYLQTRCPDVYAVGSGLGGENRLELTQQEITVALNNALFGRRQVMHYETASYSINLLSPIGRWGLTEAQAKRRYGHQIAQFQASCLPATAEHAGQISFCKLVTRDHQILGVHLMGRGAPALASILGQTANMYALNQWAMRHFQPGTLQEAIYQASEQWQHNRWCEGGWRRDWAENWFNWRRSL